MPAIRRSLLTLGVSAAAAASVALALASAAGAADPVAPTVCAGTLSGVVVRGDLFVPYDRDCTLTNVVVQGDVTAEVDAGVVTVDRSAVSGDVRTQGHRLVLRTAVVNGAVSAGEARNGVAITRSVVRGDLDTKNVEGELTVGSLTDAFGGNVVGGDLTVQSTFVDGVVARNAVAGDLVLRGNAATVTARRNVVRGTLSCVDSDPAPVGDGNLAGAKSGQCAGL